MRGDFNFGNYISLIEKQVLSLEFENCLKDIVEQSSNPIFSELSKIHFRLNGGIETENINKIFEILDLFIIVTDILDDIEDKETEKWRQNDNILVNVSTTLLSIITLELNSIDFPFRNEIVKLFFQYLVRATDGQHHDLLNKSFTEEALINNIMKKSGSLIALACVLGETLATGQFRKELEQCGYYIGVIAQLNNDYQDLMNGQNDINTKKITLPILYLLKNQSYKFDTLREYYLNPSNDIASVNISLEDIDVCGLPIYISYLKMKYRQLTLNLLKDLYSAEAITDFEKFIS